MQLLDQFKKLQQEKQKRRRVPASKDPKPPSKIVGKRVANHEAKSRWKHVNELPY